MYKIYSRKVSGLFTGLVEVWKPVKNYEGCYEVSSFGRVKSLARMRKSAHGAMAPIRERILKLKTSKSGYEVVHIRKDEMQSHPSVHRLVAEAFIGNSEDKPTVNHIDTNKTNNNVRNLEWSTHSEQMQHAVKNELLEVRGGPKFSKKAKQEIFQYHAETQCSLMTLSQKFGISERTAGRIVNNGVKPRTTTRVKKNGVTIVEDILTQEQVAEIKKLRSEGWTFKRLSEKFNRGMSQMHRVVNNLSRNSEIE